MNQLDIIAAIDGEIARLQKARTILAGLSQKRRPGRPSKSSLELSPSVLSSLTAPNASVAKKRTLSPEARAKIAKAQKARWAKARKSAA